MTPVTPAIVCLGYNRPASLTRLLRSLAMGRYGDAEVPLVISLDHGGDGECLRVAERFEWPAGPKRVLTRPTRAGLRRHVLECGDLTEEYGAIVMLEDDIAVAPGFHRYATQALRFYDGHPEVAGVALYSHRLSFASNLPFIPLPTEYDTFFLQFPASWGQAWSAGQWRGFRDWLAAAGDETIHPDLPEQVRAWPKSSWVKLFASYCRHEGKTWAYPYHAYSTNFADAGVHMTASTSLYQAALTVETGSALRFAPPGTTPADYDPYFENRSAFIAAAASLGAADFECDLYGVKPLGPNRRPYLATTRPCRVARFSTDLIYKPIELNLLYRPVGSDIRVAETAAVHGSPPPVDWRRFVYFSPNRTGVKRFAQIAGERIVRRLFTR